MSFLNIIIITFPAILLKTSPTPIGRNPGFLSKGINLQTVNASRDVVVSSSSMQSLFISWANVLRKSVDDVQNTLEVKILRHPSASRSDGPDPPFVDVAAFKTKDSSISS